MQSEAREGPPPRTDLRTRLDGRRRSFGKLHLPSASTDFQSTSGWRLGGHFLPSLLGAQAPPYPGSPRPQPAGNGGHTQRPSRCSPWLHGLLEQEPGPHLPPLHMHVLNFICQCEISSFPACSPHKPMFIHYPQFCFLSSISEEPKTTS